MRSAVAVRGVVMFLARGTASAQSIADLLPATDVASGERLLRYYKMLRQELNRA